MREFTCLRGLDGSCNRKCKIKMDCVRPVSCPEAIAQSQEIKATWICLDDIECKNCVILKALKRKED